MTEPMSPEQAGAGRPRFDPRRSTAIRSMLIETVEAEVRAGTAAAPRSPHRRRRTAVIVTLAVLAGGIASGTAAIALTGGSLFGPPEPVVTTVTPTPTPTPPPTPAPTPTPTTTVPPDPPAPVVRVPAPGDALRPESVVAERAGSALVPMPELSESNPTAYTDRRVGSLICRWNGGGTDAWTEGGPGYVQLEIVPGATPEAVRDDAETQLVYVDPLGPGVDGGSYSACAPARPSFACGYIGLVGEYAIKLQVFTSGPETMSEERRQSVADQYAAIREALTTVGPSGPLWQPAGGTIPGAIDCEGLISEEELSAITGQTAVEFTSEAGEYANAHFGAAAQVGSFSCTWALDTGGVFAAVLPGGASYFAESAAGRPAVGWAPAPDYPGEAYLSADGGTVAVLIKGAWVEVRGPAELLHAIADVVLADVGATP
ncbi:MAG: hypothetical protein Q7T71_05875 [Herbiconiux sp.]|nr:hypothetical protein [Herbiconiux sp.]